MASTAAPVDVLCMATKNEACDFKPMHFKRRPMGDYDVLIDMKYCGICHSDLHFAAGHLAGVLGKSYPCVPGHELAGVCTAVGSKVTRVKVGDQVGVGCMVDSCLNCAACKRGEEQKCTKQVATYNGKDNGSGRAATFPAGGHTLGGYTDKMVVHERFAVIIPKEYPLEYAGPVMCAGVTLFDPLRRYGCGKGTKVGIVGVGGLGQMGIKLAKALGAEVTAITRSANKAAFVKKCGADHVVVSGSKEELAKAAGSLDLIMNTIPAEHDYTVYSRLLRGGGKQILLGLHSGLIASMVVDGLTCGASKVKGSGIGGIEATQAVIDLCAKHDIYPDIKIIPVEGINEAYTDLDNNNESGVRHVIDIAGSLNEDAVNRCKAAPPKLNPHQGVGVGKIISAIMSLWCCCRWR